MEQAVLGAIIGGGSLALGYILSKLADLREQEVSYLHEVPQFRDFGKLREHLRNSPGQKADVMVEGKVEKLGNAALFSEKAGIEGAARIVYTTTRVYNEETWYDTTIENVNLSLPFKLVDTKDSYIRVESVHKAGGCRQVLQRVFQEKTLSSGSLTREFMLIFGTPLAGYGSAVLTKSSFFSEVSFTPVEVNSSISSLISRNEMIAKTFKFLSFVLLVGGGTVVVLSAVPLVVRLLSLNSTRAVTRW